MVQATHLQSTCIVCQGLLGGAVLAGYYAVLREHLQGLKWAVTAAGGEEGVMENGLEHSAEDARNRHPDVDVNDPIYQACSTSANASWRPAKSILGYVQRLV